MGDNLERFTKKDDIAKPHQSCHLLLLKEDGFACASCLNSVICVELPVLQLRKHEDHFYKNGSIGPKS